jgi:hypothetical protein
LTNGYIAFFAFYCKLLQENVAKCGKKLNFKKAGPEPIFIKILNGGLSIRHVKGQRFSNC